MQTNNLPFFLAIHSRICKNSLSAKSLIFLPQSRCIPFRFNVSKQRTSNLSVSSCANFQNQSLRRLAMSSCLRAKFFLARSRLAQDFCFLERCLLALRMALRDCLKNWGDSILEPSEQVRNVFMPKSNERDLTRLGFNFRLVNAINDHNHEQLSQWSALNG